MPLVVYHPTLKHYVDLLTQTNFLTWTYNTMLVAVVTTAVSLVLGTMIAYPLARMNFPGGRGGGDRGGRHVPGAPAAALHSDGRSSSTSSSWATPCTR